MVKQESHYAFHPIPLGPPSPKKGKLFWLLERNEPEVHFLWCTKQPTSLVVFVHGFNSSALGAWSDFDGLLPQDPEFSSTDICFFQYDGVRRQVMVSAAILRSFLANVAAGATELACSDGVGRRDTPTEYQTILLVAHSTGAIVVRQALADIAGDRQLSTKFSGIRFASLMFAPAYCGAKLSELLGEVLTGRGIVLPVVAARLAMSNAQVVSDLDPKSATLVKLREKVLALLSQKERVDLLTASRVTIGDRDGVVYAPNWYPNDPPINALVGYDHVTVCKPSSASDKRYRELKMVMAGTGVSA